MICAFFGCRQIDLYEKNTVVPVNGWASADEATGAFEIKDTSSLYEMYLVLRHTDTYPKNNIWLSIGLQAPGDSMSMQRVELPLGSDANGWDGIGMGDIWEVRKNISNGPKRFIKPGLYHFRIRQIMREDPLPGVMSVGIRLEKK